MKVLSLVVDTGSRTGPQGSVLGLALQGPVEYTGWNAVIITEGKAWTRSD